MNCLLQEYVSCPSCGRTLFDLQEISAEIREKTSHLPGVSVSKKKQNLCFFLCFKKMFFFLVVGLCKRMEFWKMVQIAIMGCIVNGPGEMADADFGYVGGSPGKIDLYVGKVTPLLLSSFLIF